jgi:hypothetical protein
MSDVELGIRFDDFFPRGGFRDLAACRFNHQSCDLACSGSRGYVPFQESVCRDTAFGLASFPGRDTCTAHIGVNPPNLERLAELVSVTGRSCEANRKPKRVSTIQRDDTLTIAI